MTITVSAVVLLLLSRFRFPERSALVQALPPPLERLAARATYDELASTVQGLERKIAPHLLVLQVTARTDRSPLTLMDVLATNRQDGEATYIPALRISPDTAVAAIAPDAHIAGVVGEPATAAEVIGTDAVRNIALLRVQPPAGSLPQIAPGELSEPAYVVIAEGTPGGFTLRPVFLGREGRFFDARWERPLVALSSVTLTSPGALVFSVDGQFLGAVVGKAGGVALGSAREILGAADSLATATDEIVDPGISVQLPTPELAAALGVEGGLVVAEVADDGIAQGILEPADVITAMDKGRVGSPDEFLLRIARHPPGARIVLDVVRRGEPLELFITIPESRPVPQSTAAGLEVEVIRGTGSVIRTVVPGSSAERAGLQPGDVIVQAGDIQAPTPGQLNAMLQTGDAYLLLRVERSGRQRLLAIAGAPGPETRP